LSRRVGLKNVALTLLKIIRLIRENPYVPVGLLLYIIRNRLKWRIYNYVFSSDSYGTRQSSLASRTVEEAVSSSDSYSTEQSSLTSRSVEETASSSDSYSMEQSSLTSRSVEETAGSADALSYSTATKKERTIDEALSESDAISYSTAQLKSRSLHDQSSAQDQVAYSKSERIIISLGEKVLTYEVGLKGQPWPEDPTKDIWTYDLTAKQSSEDRADVYPMNPNRIETLEPEISGLNVTLRGRLYGDGWTARGFKWGTKPGIYDNEWIEQGSFGEGEYSHTITVEPGKTYYYRAEAKR